MEGLFFGILQYIRKLIQCRGRIPNFFFTPSPKDPQTMSRKFHLNRNKLGISMLFLPDFSIILKTVTKLCFDKLTAYNQYILEEEFCFRVSKYEKFLLYLKVRRATSYEVNNFGIHLSLSFFFFDTMTQTSIRSIHM